jgi:hypothetical protein
METQDSAVIAEEVRQLCSQYLQEVPSRRRTWPGSIKDRIFQLLELGLSSAAIAGQTGIPIATIYHWKSVRLASLAPAFLPVKVVSDKAILPKTQPPLQVMKTAQEPRRRRRRYRKRAVAAPTIIVVTPQGIRFEGLDVCSALQIAARLGLGS